MTGSLRDPLHALKGGPTPGSFDRFADPLLPDGEYTPGSLLRRDLPSRQNSPGPEVLPYKVSLPVRVSPAGAGSYDRFVGARPSGRLTFTPSDFD